MNFKWKLPKATLRVWQIRIFIVMVLLSAVFCITLTLYIISALLLTLCVVVSFVFLPLLAKSYLITLNDTYISVEYGVIIKKIKIMPRKNLVYAESVSLPLSNGMGLSAVILKSAKGFCIIPEIEKSRADTILNGTKGENDG